MREELRQLYQELAAYEWLHPDWRVVKRLCSELDWALGEAEKVGKGHMPTLGISVSDSIATKDRPG